MKTVKLSARYKRHLRIQQGLQNEIAGRYQSAVMREEPIADLMDDFYPRIAKAKIPDWRKLAIRAFAEGVRAAAHWRARWQLYVDEKPLSSDEISNMRKAGDENVWARVCGRHEWNDGHKPFYKDAPPAKV